MTAYYNFTIDIKIFFHIQIFISKFTKLYIKIIFTEKFN